ncbi:hypothetical protein [Streptomyces sp. NPDC005262]|uniref:hypothetical protein n=1 Tax=Streptomyces sp. NPDC005262 TaxID=3364710 RepID=UPI0036C5F331
MRKRVCILLLCSLALGAGACSETTNDTDADSAAAQRGTCEELFGASGLKEIDRGIEGSDELRFKSPVSLAEARARHHDQVRKWTPKSKLTPYVESNVCMIRTNVSTGTQIGLIYKPSLFPFDTSFEKETKNAIIPDPHLTEVNPDVKIVHGIDKYREARYQVYVQCRIPGTAAGQEREVPLMGELTDTLTDSLSLRGHLSLLLHSARVMANTLNCQNKPVVPSTLPASAGVS